MNILPGTPITIVLRLLRLWLIATVSLALGGLQTVIAAGPATSVLIQSGTPQTVISGLFVGDKVEITVQLTTNDLNENGEGEPVVIFSSGGFLVVLGTYSVPRLYTFTATQINERIEAYIAGYDGDESALVTVAVNSNVKQRFTAEQKAALAQLQQEFDVLGLTIKVATTIICNGPFDAKLACRAADKISALQNRLANKLGRLALDPSDPNFMSIFTPVIPALPPVTTSDPASQPLADAINALISKEEEGIGYAGAMQVAIDRAQGAVDAGDTFWEGQQLIALARYQTALARVLDALPSLLTNLKDALLAAGVPHTSITPQNVFDTERDIALHGLSSDEIQTLVQLGATNDEIDEIKNVMMVQDINAVAGDFPDKIADASFLATLHGTALALNPDNTPPNITVSADPARIWPPDHRGAQVTISGSVSDDLSGIDPTSATFVVMDEYGAVQPTGSFTIQNDGTFSFALQLDAWRDGKDLDGRHYSIHVTAADNAGNIATRTISVLVPHDQGEKKLLKL
ncbi:MAG: large repetitive protein [Verrucomicrobiota bacterium]